MNKNHGSKQDTDRSEATVRLQQAVHDLRNGMNTLVMNAAVLGTRAHDVPEALRPFVERIAVSGKKCNDELAKVLSIVDETQRRG